MVTALATRTGSWRMSAVPRSEVIVDAAQPEIPVGIDGETVMMPTPVRCSILPRALRVVVPRARPGAARPGQSLSWSRLGRLAAGSRDASATQG